MNEVSVVCISGPYRNFGKITANFACGRESPEPYDTPRVTEFMHEQAKVRFPKWNKDVANLKLWPGELFVNLLYDFGL